MTALRPEIARFLDDVCPGAQTTAIVGDVSTRRFYRVRDPAGGTRVLVDYGAPFEGETDDVRLARLFREAGLRTAEIAEVCGPAGCLLVEDLGDMRLESAVAGGQGDTRELLGRAATLAAQVATRGTPVLARSDRRDGPSLDAERFRFEMDYFVEHLRRQPGSAIEAPPTGIDAKRLHALAERSLPRRPGAVLCHRDFHSRNLMLLHRTASLAMVDIQDARWGPDAYDLASLLRDGYIEIDEELGRAADRSRYLSQRWTTPRCRGLPLPAAPRLGAAHDQGARHLRLPGRRPRRRAATCAPIPRTLQRLRPRMLLPRSRRNPPNPTTS